MFGSFKIDHAGTNDELSMFCIKSPTQENKDDGNSLKMWLYVITLWVFKILIQNGWRATRQRNEQPQTAKHTPQETIFSSHPSPAIQCGGPSRQSASQAGGSQQRLISPRLRRKQRSSKGLRSFPLPPGAGRNNKTSPFGEHSFISNAVAVF